ncbi:TonB-dependent receptor [Candidatus Venteria ishoeyi]|uniref:TonB-dependent receptor plug domain-containing protein n=1 Tax=Candidatus Venteria ishoeyi TaxID=1899563 RepID=UPI0025A5E702|nr:TonB-dependent receptor [Candidatus Venteria ishoeyi]MDM8545400.1 TonB-dependent receptor [Candidatus Venteria ishoeyi]
MPVLKLNPAHFSLLLIMLFLLLPSQALYADENALSVSDTGGAIEQLKQLDLADLLEVDVTLDDVFDIFDALVQQQNVQVATGSKQSIARAPAVTSVISAQDIEATGARDIDEVLEMIPGFHVSRHSTAYNPIYSLRGIKTDFQVLMMVNDIPIDTLYTGGRNAVWGGMSVKQIARVEVIRGPGSAVHGADAFAGAINIITKNKNDIDGTRIGSRLGSYNMRDVWLEHGQKLGALDMGLVLEYQTTDGHDPLIRRDGQSTLDQELAHYAIPALSFAPATANLQRKNLDMNLDLGWKYWKLRLGYQGHYDTALGINYNNILDPKSRFEDQRYRADLTYHNPLIADNWDVTTRLSYLDMQSKATENQIQTRPGFTVPVTTGQDFLNYPEGIIFNSGINERQMRLDVSAFYFGFEQHSLRMGAGYSYGQLYEITHETNIDPVTGMPVPLAAGLLNLSDTPYVFLPEEKRKSWYVFLQDHWKFYENWELTTGLRYDHYSDFGGTLNPRFALVWQPIPKLTAKLLYGHAFRAPSFVELYNQNNLIVQGNPNVKAETIDTTELALNYYVNDRLHLGVNIYTFNWQDALQFQFSPDLHKYIVQNNERRKGQGLELEARWKVGKRLSLLANYALQRITTKHINVTSTSQDAYLRADWLLMPKWYLNAQLNWVGSRERNPVDAREDLGAYTQIDLTLRYKDIRYNHWNLAFGIRNIFDEPVIEPSTISEFGEARLPDDLPMPGRNYFIELSYRF